MLKLVKCFCCLEISFVTGTEAKLRDYEGIKWKDYICPTCFDSWYDNGERKLLEFKRKEAEK